MQNQPPESETGEGEGSSQNDLSADAGRSDAGENAMEPPSAVGGDIPKYDLAENILAEQRRVASRRRRAPTQVEEKPAAPPERGEAVPSLPETPSEDLPELQRIVAEIVAKDIDRLCRRPER